MVWLLWPHHIVLLQSPEEFSLVFPLILDTYWTSIFSSLSLLMVPERIWRLRSHDPEVPAVPHRKLGTGIWGIFLKESTSLPFLLLYKVLWYPLCRIYCTDKTHLNADSCRWTHLCHRLYGKNRPHCGQIAPAYKRRTAKTYLTTRLQRKNWTRIKLFWFFFGPEVRQSYQGMLMVKGKWDIWSKQGTKIFISGF